MPVARHVLRPNPEMRRATSNISLFGLAPSGVYLASQSPGCWWALTPPFHPYRLSKRTA